MKKVFRQNTFFLYIYSLYTKDPNFISLNLKF